MVSMKGHRKNRRFVDYLWYGIYAAMVVASLVGLIYIFLHH
jgi:hypothetical protein